MREVFSAYYPLSQEQFKALWNEAAIILDTNVLFGLYRYSQETSNELLGLFKQLRARLFMPNQVALEYHRNRITIIGEQCKIYATFMSESERAINKIKEELKSKRHPFIKNTQQVLSDADRFLSGLTEQIAEKQSSINRMLTEDQILSDLTTLFEKRVGKKYDPIEVQRIYEEGDRRYRLKIPPGYSDSKKPEEQKYGDLIVWYQMIDQARSTKKPVIFVTEDEKEDWWWTVDGKKIGPRPELVDEIHEKASVAYYSYALEPFMTHSRKYLKKKIAEKAVSEIRKLSLLDARALTDYTNQISSFIGSTDFSALAKYQESLKSLQQYITPAFLQGLSDIQKQWNTIDLTWKYAGILPQSTWGIPTLLGTASPNIDKPIPESDKANGKHEEEPDESRNDGEEDRGSK